MARVVSAFMSGGHTAPPAPAFASIIQALRPRIEAGGDHTIAADDLHRLAVGGPGDHDAAGAVAGRPRPPHDVYREPQRQQEEPGQDPPERLHHCRLAPSSTHSHDLLDPT